MQLVNLELPEAKLSYFFMMYPDSSIFVIAIEIELRCKLPTYLLQYLADPFTFVSFLT